MEPFSALLALCAGNSPVSGEFPAQRPETRSFDVFFDLRVNKRLSKQSLGWFETLSRSLWRHRNILKQPLSVWTNVSHHSTITCNILNTPKQIYIYISVMYLNDSCYNLTLLCHLGHCVTVWNPQICTVFAYIHIHTYIYIYMYIFSSYHMDNLPIYSRLRLVYWYSVIHKIFKKICV